MAKQFEDQGGMATMDPSPLVRWVSSKVMPRLLGRAAVDRRRAKAERARQRAGEPHRIEYFHQLDDGYSHLAAQLLRPVLERYDVELELHLVSAEPGRNLPEPELLLELSRLDSAKVAPHYGLRFPEHVEAADPKLVELAGRTLAAASTADAPRIAVAVGDALWARDAVALEAGAVDQEIDPAMRLFEQALSLAPRYGPGYYYLAEAWLAKNNFSQARAFHHQAALYLENNSVWEGRVVRQGRRIDRAAAAALP